MDRYDEALAKARVGKSLEEIFPELKESEDERIREVIPLAICGTTAEKVLEANGVKLVDAIAYLEKQKENAEKEYVFRPLAGTDITIAAAQAIKKAQEGDRLVLEFNGMYIPVRKYNTAKELVDAYDAYLEKQKEQKPAEWSEEDEEALRELLNILSRRDVELSDDTEWLSFKLKNWHKSLRSRPKSWTT